MLAVAPATIDDGGGVLNETVIPEDRSMVIGLVLVVALVAEVAVMTTVVAGTLLGAV
jgi:hypothetical protein